MKAIGCDISMNHGAVVEITDDEVTNHWYYSTKAGVSAKSKQHGTRLPEFKELDRHRKGLARLAWIENWFDKVVLVPSAPDFASLEDYAVRAEHQAHYLGEVGGIARILLWFRGIHFRLHDPMSVKLYVSHDGSADKELVRIDANERWGVSFDQYIVGKDKETAEDLADAHALARLVVVEAKLRSGVLTTRDLEHDQERRVFNRTTKTNPTNLLDREWIYNPEGTSTPHGRFPGCSAESCLLGKLDREQLISPKLKRQLVKKGKQ